MTSAERHDFIVELIKRHGKVTVEQLVREFGVTAQSVRSDLRSLEQRKKLVRFHGGARAIEGVTNVEYEERRKMAASEKAAIGQHAATLIDNDSSVFITIGTTTEAVSVALQRHHGLLVVTNNINVANTLRYHADIDVVIAGGAVRTSDGGIVGDAAVDFISQYKVDYAIIGASAIDRDGTLLDYDIREVKVSQAVMANARKVILVADSNKFMKSAPVRIAHLSQIDHLITNKVPDDALRELCIQHDIELSEVT